MPLQIVVYLDIIRTESPINEYYSRNHKLKNAQKTREAFMRVHRNLLILISKMAFLLDFSVYIIVVSIKS